MANGRLKPEKIQVILHLNTSAGSWGPTRIAERLRLQESQVKKVLSQYDPRHDRVTEQVQTVRRRVVDPLQLDRFEPRPHVLRREVTPGLKRAILVMLRRNSLPYIRRRFSLPHKLVREISKSGNSAFHKIGRGRFSARKKPRF